MAAVPPCLDLPSETTSDAAFAEAVEYGRGVDKVTGEAYYWKHTDPTPVRLHAADIEEELREAIDELAQGYKEMFVSDSRTKSLIPWTMHNFKPQGEVTQSFKRMPHARLHIKEAYDASPKRTKDYAGFSQQYLKIIGKCERSGKKWVDPDFDTSSMLPSDIKQTNVEWVRLGALKPGMKVVADKASPCDVVPGALGDSWLIAALATLAGKEHGVTDAFVSTELSEHGIYGVYLYDQRLGAWHEVLIDDYIPWQGDRPLFASARDLREMWVSLLEKAFAKFYGGYQALRGGFPGEALSDLTGGIPGVIGLRDPRWHHEIATGRMWTRLTSYKKLGYFLMAGTDVGGIDGVSQASLIENHTYTIVDTVEVDGSKLLLLRNPFGAELWDGDWSDADTVKWTARMKRILGFHTKDLHSFYISLEDFLVNFPVVHYCKVFHKACFHQQTRYGNFYGGMGHENFSTAKKFSFKVQTATHFEIVLSQKAPRRREMESLEPIHVAVMTDKWTTLAESPYNADRDVALDVVLAKPNVEYFIVVRAQHNVDLPFFLRVLSDRPVTLRK